MAEPGLLLIRGLGHSGSTILDLALGSHPQLIGLGEAVRVLERPRRGEEYKGPQQPDFWRLSECGSRQTHARKTEYSPLLLKLILHLKGATQKTNFQKFKISKIQNFQI